MTSPETETGPVLVTGATGAVGPALVRALLADGAVVRVLSRRPDQARLLLPGAAVFSGDILDGAALRAAMPGVRVVFHLAACVPEGRAASDEMMRVNVDGTRTVVRAAAAAGVARIVLSSSINVYGAGGTAGLLTEADALRPETAYARSKVAAEAVAVDERGGGDLVILRLAAVYGPSMHGNYLRLLRALERRRFAAVGDGRALRTLVYEGDVARAALLAAAHPAAAGGVFNVTDGEVHSVTEVIAAACAALGRSAPRLRLPAAPVRFAASVAERAWRAAGRRPPVTREGVDALLRSVAVSGAKLERVTGSRPEVDLASGWRHAVRALS
ncbi:MAG TPA: NAD-dependent epimerase/dehydratase family protein [Longimicrobiales bacterium]|nr:NAD-dependent epimerase/dehydratase family protein [Longimicrobiales bacterium]